MNFFRKLENLCRYLNGILYATNARMKKNSCISGNYIILSDYIGFEDFL